MQLKAKLTRILPLQTGTGRNGEWKKQDIIVETLGQYPKQVCVSIWGDKLNGVTLTEQEVYLIDFDIESREYNGRWYTDVKAWRVKNEKEVDNNPSSYAPPAEDMPHPFSPSDEGKDLPF